MHRVLLGAVLLSLACRGQDALTLENQGLRLELRSSDASLRLIDKRTGVDWAIRPPQAILKDKRAVSVEPRDAVRSGNALRYRAEHGLEFELRLADSPPSIHYSFQAGPEVEEVRLLDKSLPLEAGARNYYAVPLRLGVLIPVEGDQPFTRRMPAYTGIGWSRTLAGIPVGCSMTMFGAVKNGSALLAAWENDPYTELIVDYSVEPRRQLAAGLAFRLAKGWLRLQPLGGGGYVEIAKAYRPIARERGYLKTLAEKLRETPSLEKTFGAANIKPFVFNRRLANTPRNPTSQDVLQVNFTFDEAAQLAEHYKNDLGIDRAMFVLAGWINGGYDIRHPDILPAAPELGGDEALAACGRRVKALGWLFGLHDNYQDIYRDSPSWNEDLIMKNADGSLHKGGVWAGGQCWLICSKKGLELAKRPQNVPRVKELFAPTIYFSDTVFNAPPYECFDPNHPLSKSDDIKYKIELSDYLRAQFGLFGSEEGREWNVPHGDYLEGLMSHRTHYQDPKDTDIIIPLFELVYGDAVALYSHQGDRPRPDNPTYVLDHILYAEMPIYYFGTHRYWTDPSQDFQPPAGAEPRLVFARGGQFGLVDQFIKNTYEVLSPLNRVTALLPMTDHRFATPDRSVETTRFGDDVEITVNYGSSPFTTRNAVLPQYGFVVEGRSLVAFYASRYRGLNYREPTLMVMRATDGRPLSSSREVRFYRGFGDHRIEWRGKVLEVEGHERVEPSR